MIKIRYFHTICLPLSLDRSDPTQKIAPIVLSHHRKIPKDSAICSQSHPKRERVKTFRHQGQASDSEEKPPCVRRVKAPGEAVDGTAHQSSECSSRMIAHLLICSASSELSMGRVFIWQLPAMVPSIITIAAPIYSWREPICDAQAGKRSRAVRPSTHGADLLGCVGGQGHGRCPSTHGVDLRVCRPDAVDPRHAWMTCTR